MEDEDLICSVLSDIDIAVLRRLGPREYVPIGQAPDFYRELYPDDENGPCSAPWEHSDMLAFFLDDAENFFEENKPGMYASSFWQEEGVGEENALWAQALITSKGQAILVRRFHYEYVERAKIVLKFREGLLEKRKLKREMELYRNISRFDRLTSLFNRAAFMEIMKDEIEMAKETGAHLSLLIMDIDHFKHVNDTYGHLTGDAVLASLGEILLSRLRSEDVAARYGGEEFVVLVRNTAKEQAFNLAEDLRRHIEAFDFPTIHRATVSVGCTEYIAPETMNEFIERADMAMYDAKHDNRNNVKAR